MEILLDRNDKVAPHLFEKKLDTDEEIVRRELVREWTKILEKYARPGMQIPSVDAIRNELIEKGVDVAVSAIVDEHWFVFPWMIYDDMRARIERGLAHFNLEKFMADVRIAQHDLGMLNHLRQEIRNHVLFGDFN